MRVFTDPYSPVLSLYGRIRVSEHMHSRIFHVVKVLEWKFSLPTTQLTFFLTMLPFNPPENIIKLKVFWYFQGDQK